MKIWTIRNLNLKSQFSIFDSLRDIGVHIYDLLKFVAVEMGVVNFFWSIDSYWWEQYISVKIFILASKLYEPVLGGLWALEWAWYLTETNLAAQEA